MVNARELSGAELAVAAPPARARAAAAARLWDYRSPDKLSRDHVRSLVSLHQSFCRFASAALGARLRTAVTLRLGSLEQALYEDYVALLPDGCLFATIGMTPLSGRMVIELSSELARCMTELLIGGDGTNVETDRELTDIDLGLARALIRTILEALVEAWSPIQLLEPSIMNLVDSLETAPAASPSDPVVIVLIEITINGRVGSASLCLPHRVLETVLLRLSAQVSAAEKPARTDDESRLRLESLLREALLRVTAQAGETEIRLSELLTLQRGDVLLLGGGREFVVDIRVADRVRFRGHPGLVGGRVAVRIDQVEGTRRHGIDTSA